MNISYLERREKFGKKVKDQAKHNKTAKLKINIIGGFSKRSGRFGLVGAARVNTIVNVAFLLCL